MGRNRYKLTKIFDDVIVMLILLRHQNATPEKIESLSVSNHNEINTFCVLNWNDFFC